MDEGVPDDLQHRPQSIPQVLLQGSQGGQSVDADPQTGAEQQVDGATNASENEDEPIDERLPERGEDSGAEKYEDVSKDVFEHGAEPEEGCDEWPEAHANELRGGNEGTAGKAGEGTECGLESAGEDVHGGDERRQQTGADKLIDAGQCGGEASVDGPDGAADVDGEIAGQGDEDETGDPEEPGDAEEDSAESGPQDAKIDEDEQVCQAGLERGEEALEEGRESAEEGLEAVKSDEETAGNGLQQVGVEKDGNGDEEAAESALE